MSTIPTMVITPAGAADAYAKIGNAQPGGSEATSFDSLMKRALGGVIDTGHAAEDQASQAIRGDGNLSEVVTALSRAELTLQTATSIRDRVIQAYQDIMKMPI